MAAPSESRSTRAELLESLLARHGSALRRQAARNVQRPADAEDALHDACVQFLRAYDEPADLDRAFAWMRLTVKRCAWAIGYRASRRFETAETLVAGEPLPAEERHPAAIPVDDRPGPAELVERSCSLAQRWRLLTRLKPDERTALILLGFGFSYREIAERQGWTYTKVNRCLSEGRERLHRLDVDESQSE